MAKTTTFQPRIRGSLIYTGLVVVAILAAITVYIMSKVAGFQAQFPHADEARTLSTTLTTILLGVWVAIGLTVVYVSTNYQRRKIWIHNHLLHFESNPLLGTHRATTINLKQTTLITHRVDQRIVPAGKMVTSIAVYYWIFKDTKGGIEEIEMTGWDKQTLIEICQFIAKQYPQMPINTHVYTDSALKISGLDQYMEQAKKFLPKSHSKTSS